MFPVRLVKNTTNFAAMERKKYVLDVTGHKFVMVSRCVI